MDASPVHKSQDRCREVCRNGDNESYAEPACIRRWTLSLIDYLENGFPRLHVGEDFNIVGGLGECGCVVIGVDDQDVDSHWGALLDTIRCHHLETRKVCRSIGFKRTTVCLSKRQCFIFICPQLWFPERGRGEVKWSKRIDKVQKRPKLIRLVLFCVGNCFSSIICSLDRNILQVLIHCNSPTIRCEGVTQKRPDNIQHDLDIPSCPTTCWLHVAFQHVEGKSQFRFTESSLLCVYTCTQLKNRCVSLNTAAQNSCKQSRPFSARKHKMWKLQSLQSDIHLNWIDVLSLLRHRQFLENWFSAALFKRTRFSFFCPIFREITSRERQERNL